MNHYESLTPEELTKIIKLFYRREKAAVYLLEETQRDRFEAELEQANRKRKDIKRGDS